MTSFKSTKMTRRSSQVVDIKVVCRAPFSFELAASDPQPDNPADPGLPLPPFNAPFSLSGGTLGVDTFTRMLHIDPAALDAWHPTFNRGQTIHLAMTVTDGTMGDLTLTLECADHPRSALKRALRALVTTAIFILSLPFALFKLHKKLNSNPETTRRHVALSGHDVATEY